MYLNKNILYLIWIQIITDGEKALKRFYNIVH